MNRYGSHSRLLITSLSPCVLLDWIAELLNPDWNAIWWIGLWLTIQNQNRILNLDWNVNQFYKVDLDFQSYFFCWIDNPKKLKQLNQKRLTLIIQIEAFKLLKDSFLTFEFLIEVCLQASQLTFSINFEWK